MIVKKRFLKNGSFQITHILTMEEKESWENENTSDLVKVVVPTILVVSLLNAFIERKKKWGVK